MPWEESASTITYWLTGRSDPSNLVYQLPKASPPMETPTGYENIELNIQQGFH